MQTLVQLCCTFLFLALLWKKSFQRCNELSLQTVSSLQTSHEMIIQCLSRVATHPFHGTSSLGPSKLFHHQKSLRICGRILEASASSTKAHDRAATNSFHSWLVLISMNPSLYELLKHSEKCSSELLQCDVLKCLAKLIQFNSEVRVHIGETESEGLILLTIHPAVCTMCHVPAEWNVTS